jgi:predicted phosphodiesterase
MIEPMIPGRSCPLHYRYAPAALARKADFEADTLYVIGGLYGNTEALHTILDMTARENATLVFNGDFNWFNVDDTSFTAINDTVLKYRATRGNVETELVHDGDEAGCGCGYPDTVSDAEVERSNTIIVRLRNTARTHRALCDQLAQLPMHAVAGVAGERVAIVHGDLESLAGWQLAHASLLAVDSRKIVQKQLVTSNCRILASSHTCQPVAARLGDGVVFNNGAAGMPNFAGTHYGVITRIAATPSPHPVLYGTRVNAAHVDALAVHYDHERWLPRFTANWPQGSPAHESYFRRIVAGPAFTVTQAMMLSENAD